MLGLDLEAPVIFLIIESEGSA